ncbi:ABC transporter permease [Fervidicoccus fontis]|uniref:ABC transporter permease n=1 Tax=Fervidicoccus fontis TaxID=683846 RepID=A0A843AAN1_9CREN|nr:ABC transporter permease [Fervidicoccus fontis]MBE9391755.1 ABC transporter permease [Fervidicoccus fontis]
MSKRFSTKGLKRFFGELKRSKVGIAGFTLFLIFLLLALLFPYIGNMNDIKNWDNLQYWQDNPKAVPPCWAMSNQFSTVSVVGEEKSDNLIVRTGEFENFTYKEYSFMYELKNVPPNEIIFSFNINYNSPVYVMLVLTRPDNKTLYLTGNPISGQYTSITNLFGVSPNSYTGSIRLPVSTYINNMVTDNTYILPWLQENNITLPIQDVYRLPSLAFNAIHEVLSPNMLETTSPTYLTGTYNWTIMFYSTGNFTVNVKEITALGGCYGIFGTDNVGRDLFMGLIYGIRWALIIGFSVSVISVLFGGLYGVIGGYLGGKTDEILLRVAQIFYSIPILPILILLAIIFRPSIWNVISMLIIFGWPSTAIVTRSMALQIKEETYVEAAKALGASSSRILLRYIFPQVLPYLFASMALSVPGAILTEASLSFLGLGDPSIVTWGRILNEAEIAGATINGYWWWVIPPGLMITLIGLTFILIGQALDTILNPKLKR